MKYIFYFFGILLYLLIAPVFAQVHATWDVRSVDTMKFSRDLAREKLTDPTFDVVIEEQIQNIANTGATHVAIGTPYDEEFVPYLTRWVQAARRHNLNVWFRGNFSGWEKWFDYPAINREQHKLMTHEFILQHKNIFEDGDIFTPCPECENGGPGDPRMNGDAAGHREFLIDEYQLTKNTFADIGVDVVSNYNSMNGDVAKLIMDRETTKALDGVVVVDHYVGSTERLAREIQEYADASGGRVVLGEFGAPIPDLHGNMNEQEQAAWIEDALTKLSRISSLEGINYWTNVGGSTELWSAEGAPREAVSTLSHFYMPKKLEVQVKNALGETLLDAQAKIKRRTFKAKNGTLHIYYTARDNVVLFSSEGYKIKSIMLPQNSEYATIQLEKEHEDFIFKFRKLLKFLFRLPQS